MINFFSVLGRLFVWNLRIGYYLTRGYNSNKRSQTNNSSDVNIPSLSARDSSSTIFLQISFHYHQHICDRMYAVFFKAFLTVLLPTTAVCFIVYHGFFDDIFTEVGEKHYAEKSNFLKTIVPKWMKMPLNTLVNFGYVIVGAYWLAVTSVALKNKTMSDIDGHIFYVFNFMAIVYGPIQALRIITQKHSFAVLDQWYTLPFFMWVFLWGMYLKNKWSVFRAFIWMTWSICAYSMSLYHKHGFEVILSFHIFLAVLGGAFAYRKYPTSKCIYPFVMALLSCIGFVILKLADHHLPTFHPIFYTVSGHFLSKISDILQIHYVNLYFQSIISYKMIEETKKKS